MADLKDLEPGRFKFLADLIVRMRRIGQATFKATVPKEVEDDPSVFAADDVIDRLINTRWTILLPDGHAAVLSFTELMVLTHQLEFFKETQENANRIARKKKMKAALVEAVAVHAPFQDFCSSLAGVGLV